MLLRIFRNYYFILVGNIKFLLCFNNKTNKQNKISTDFKHEVNGKLKETHVAVQLPTKILAILMIGLRNLDDYLRNLILLIATFYHYLSLFFC